MNTFAHKTILVTGAKGFIGSHLVAYLSQIDGVRLLLLSRQTQVSNKPNIKWLKGSLHDLTASYWQDLDIKNIDVVFHLGAFIPKKGCDVNLSTPVFHDNLLGTQVLLDGLPLGVRNIVFSSTIDVYAPMLAGELLTENTAIKPASLYGASKLFCEKLVSVWAVQHQCHYAILRYGHIFGPGEEAYQKLIPLVIQDLLAGKSPNVYGSGSAARDFLYVSDAVEATVRAATVNQNIEPTNIVRGKSQSIREIVEILIEKMDSKQTINFLNDKPDGYSLRFDSSQMKHWLGIWPLKSLEDGLVEEIHQFRSL